MYNSSAVVFFFFCHKTPRPIFMKLEVGLSDIWMFVAALNFWFHNIRLGCGENSLRDGRAMEHEQTSCQCMTNRCSRNEVWHFVIRDEGPKHFNWHSSMSRTVRTIAGIRCSMRCLPQILTVQLHQSRWLFISWHNPFHCFQCFRPDWERLYCLSNWRYLGFL